MSLLIGRFRFVYNLGNGRIFIYDIFDSGQIRETNAHTNEINYVTSEIAINKLEEMLNIEKRKYQKYKKTPLINKTIASKIEQYKIMGRFMEEHYITEDDIKWFQ